MKRLKSFNKFYRRYEVDLWGRSGYQRNNKTVRFLYKIQNEKIQYSFNPGRSFKKKRVKFKNQLSSSSVSSSMFKAKKKNFIDLNINSTRKQKGNFKLKSKYKHLTKIINTKKLKAKRKPFLYRIDYADPKRKRAKTSLARELFLVKTKLLKFYNNIKKDQIRRYANTKTFKIKFKAARGYTNKALLKYHSSNSLKKRLALNAFFSLVEHRLDVMLFRSNLVQTMLQSRQFINHNHILVNQQIVSHSGYILNNFDVVSLSFSIELKMRKKLLQNLRKKNITLYSPKYIYSDYRLMRACIVSNPLVKQVPFPFKIDLRKWLGLAKYLF